MDPNQFHWQAYYNLLQNYQMTPSTKNSQNPPPFFPYLPLPPSMNFMQNNQTLSTENSQNPPPFFPYLPLPPMNFMQNNQSISTKNSQNSPLIFSTCHHHHHQWILCKTIKSPSTENSHKVLKLFLKCHKTILPCFVSFPIVLVMHKILSMMMLKCNFHNFLLKLH